MDFSNPLCSAFVAGTMSSRPRAENGWKVRNVKTPHRRLTREQSQALNVKIDALSTYQWDNACDIISHVTTVNEMIQEIIWDGYEMDPQMGFYVLRNTIPEEWHGLMRRVWLDCTNYRELVLRFLTEFIRVGATKTSSLGMSGSWRRQNAPWR